MIQTLKEKEFSACLFGSALKMATNIKLDKTLETIDTVAAQHGLQLWPFQRQTIAAVLEGHDAFVSVPTCGRCSTIFGN